MSWQRSSGARGAIAKAITPLLPAGWQLVEHEASLDDTEAVRVRLTVQSIAPADTGYAAHHIVTVRATITVPTEDLKVAEPRLEDELDELLFAFDKADIAWGTATKGRYADENGRLGFQLDLITRTKTPEESING